MPQGSLFIVTAPSGAGKTSLVKALLEREPDLRLSISYTTRAPRPGEENGVHYHFVNRDTFIAMLGSGAFLESAEVYGNFYGTSHAWIREQIAAGADVLLEIDWQGALQVRRMFPDAVGIFVLPPSIEELRRRLTGRGTDSVEVIERRLAAAREDMAHAPEADYVVFNDRFEAALDDLSALIHSARLRYAIQAGRIAPLLA